MASVTLSKAKLIPANLSMQADNLTVSSTLKIFNSCKVALPGQPVFVQGAFSASAKVGFKIAGEGIYAEASIVNQSQNGLTFIVPVGVAYTQYQVFVIESGQRSNYWDYNKTEIHFLDTSTVYVGATIRVIGQNLSVPGGTTTVRLVHSSNATSISANVISTGSKYEKIAFIAPLGLTTGAVYNVYVSNGLTTSQSEVLSPYQLTTVAVAEDVLNVGVAWAVKATAYYANQINVKTDSRVTTKATGDGTTNDQPMIQQAMNVARDTPGGFVYLPNGTYYLGSSGSQLDFKSKVFLVGESRDGVILTYAKQGAPSCDVFHMESDVTLAGMANLTIQNQGGTGTNYYLGGFYGTEFFMKNVKAVMGNSGAFSMSVTKIAVVDCDLDNKIAPSDAPPMSLNNSKDFTVRNTNFRFSSGPGFDNTKRGLVDGCTFIKDVSYGKRSGAILHVSTNNFSDGFLWTDCQFKGANGEITRISNDNESMLWEDSGEQLTAVSGTVTSATSTTLVDSTKTFPGTLVSDNAFVRITAGTGIGQTRYISAVSTGTLTLSASWDVQPDTTSKYATGRILARNVSVVDSSFEGMQRGPTVYFANTDYLSFRNLNLKNSGAIDISPTQNDRTDHVQVGTCWNIMQRDCTLDSRNDPDNGNFIGVHGGTSGSVLYGAQALNCAFVNNFSVNALTPQNTIVDDSYPPGLNDYGFKPNGPTPTIPTIFGSVFWKNIVINSGQQRTVNAASYGAVFKGNVFVSCGAADNNGRGVGAPLNLVDL